jgi:outer membrane lipoprotein-sorting protein
VRRALVLPLVLAAIAAGAPAPVAQDARAAVEAFAARVWDVQISDLVIDQSLTLYHPDGQRRVSGGEQRMMFKLPQRQRVEQTVEGQREIQLTVGDRVWVRRPDGQVLQAPATEQARALTHVLVPVKRRAADLLAEWRSRGIRDDVSHTASVGGRPVVVIGAHPGDRDVPAVWLDPDYGVVRIVTRERLPNTSERPPSSARLLDLALSEHRPLAGKLYFPYRQELFVDGKLLVLFTVRAVAINTNPPDALFDPASLKAP